MTAAREPGRRRNECGYILLEAAIALVLLTVGAYAVHGALRQAILTRGQAQDYTAAKFLLEQVISDIEFQPFIAPEKKEGRFEGEYDRFSWTAEVNTIDIPKPEVRLNPEAEGDLDPEALKLQTPALAHVIATIAWQRGGQTFTETMETLFDYQKLWIEKEEQGP
jgi:hypothetical protein